MENPEQITYFGETDSRNRRISFGIKALDRTKHVYVIGKTGMGKSTMLENMAAQDVRNGNGFAFLDPHGSAIDTILKYIPKERVDDVIYFAPFDIEYPIAFNVMEDVGFDKRHLVVSGLMSTFKKIWQDAWSARMEYILGNTLLALLEYPNATLLDVNRMYSDKDFRKKVVDNVSDLAVRSFWVDEFAKYTDRFASEATPAIQNKIGQFTANPLIRNIIGQPKSSFDFREVMDNKKILIVNLSKGRIGETNANLLGSMIITKLYLAALSRADKEKDEIDKLPNFYLYVDEFQSFANESFAGILSEARKYKLNLTIAHQYIEQMSDEVRAAVFGNVGTMVTFRVGSYDAEVLEKEFSPVFEADDIVNLGAYQIYLRLMIDGIGSQPFSARTLPPLEKPQVSFVEEIIGSSRRRNTTPRAEAEKNIKDRFFSNADNQNNQTKKHHDPHYSHDAHNNPQKNEDKKEEYHKEKSAISKRQAEELKKTLLEKEKQGIQGEVTDNDQNDSSPEEVSLSELSLKVKRTNPKNKKSSNNKNGLKEALYDILGDIEKNNSKVIEKSKKKEFSSKPEHPDSRRDSNHGEPKDNSSSIRGDEKHNDKTNTGVDAIKEIPENELRKMLDV